MLTVLDLFSGIGGFSLGLDRTGGFRTVAFCERDAYATAVLRRHWPGVPVFDDVRTLGRDSLSAAGVGPVDVVCGGFPCQDISLAGLGAGLSGARSGLWFEMHRIIAETRPEFVIAENVSALRSRGLDVVLGSLAAIGYDAEWHCIPASAVGAPHRRDRVWIIASDAMREGLEGHGRPRGAGEEVAEFARAGGDVDNPECIGRTARWDDNAEHDGPQLGAAGQYARDVADADRCSGGRDRGGFPTAQGAPRGKPDPLGSGPGRGGLLRRVDRDGAQWITEPDVGRVAHGIPRRVDRLRCLGNAVVPQIPELIGRSILQAVSITETTPCT